jgi:hypothetical protein
MTVLADGQPAGPPVAGQQTLPPELEGYARLVTDLDEIQRETGLYFPMPSSLSEEEQYDILIAKQLVAGEVVTAEWTSSKMTLPVRSLEGLKELASGEVRQLWVRRPFILNLEGQEYPLGYVLRTHATAKIDDWPTLPADTPPDAEIEIPILPGSDDTVTMRLVTADELEASPADSAVT